MHRIDQSFFETQLQEGLALAAESDVLALQPIRRSEDPPQHYVAQFRNCGLVKKTNGQIGRATAVHFGLFFSDQYLRHPPGAELITILRPAEFFHSNTRFPFVCLGKIKPGTPLVELLFSLYALVTYRLWNTNDALDPVAAEWLRGHQAELPLDSPPLRRRKAPLSMRLTVKERS